MLERNQLSSTDRAGKEESSQGWGGGQAQVWGGEDHDLLRCVEEDEQWRGRIKNVRRLDLKAFIPHYRCA